MQEPGPVVAVGDPHSPTPRYHVRVDCENGLRVNPQPRNLLTNIYGHFKTPLRLQVPLGKSK